MFCLLLSCYTPISPTSQEAHKGQKGEKMNSEKTEPSGMTWQDFVTTSIQLLHEEFPEEVEKALKELEIPVCKDA